MKMPVAFGGSMLLVRSSQIRIAIRTTRCSLPKAKLCGLPRRSIRYRCCTLQRLMAKCRLESLHYRTRRPTHWTCGMTHAWPRVSSGNGQVMMLAYQMTFAGFPQRTRMRSPTEYGMCSFVLTHVKGHARSHYDVAAIERFGAQPQVPIDVCLRE